MTTALRTLLRRAKAVEAAQRPETVSPPSDEPWPVGAHVVRELAGADRLEGRVAFVDEGWVYWAAIDGRVHASMPEALRRTA